MKTGLRCGARLIGLKPEILGIIPLAVEVFRNYAHPFYYTSGTDGKHGRRSHHRFGLAIDFDFDEGLHDSHIGEDMAADLRDCLGPDYDVIFEGNHFHIEYDPKTQPIVETAPY